MEDRKKFPKFCQEFLLPLFFQRRQEKKGKKKTARGQKEQKSGASIEAVGKDEQYAEGVEDIAEIQSSGEAKLPVINARLCFLWALKFSGECRSDIDRGYGE